MHELLATYYGMQRGADRSSDVESNKFDAKLYVRGLLRNDRVETLLRKDDEMVRGRPSGSAWYTTAVFAREETLNQRSVCIQSPIQHLCSILDYTYNVPGTCYTAVAAR